MQELGEHLQANHFVLKNFVLPFMLVVGEPVMVLVFGVNAKTLAIPRKKAIL